MTRIWKVSIWAVVAACVALAAMATGAMARPQVKPARPRAGQLDKTFGKNGLFTLGQAEDTNQVTFVTPGGKVFFASDNGVIIGLTSNGKRNKSFGTNGRVELAVPAGYKFEAAGVRVDSEGRVLVAGTTASQAGSPGRAEDGWWIPIPATATVYRFLPDGTPDPSFGEGGVTRTALDQGLPDMSLRPGEKFSTGVYAAGNAGGGGNAITVTGLTVTSDDRPVLALEVPNELVQCRDYGYPVFDQRTLVAALTTAGSVDSGFGVDGVTEVAGERAVGPTAVPGGGVAVATDPERLCSENAGGLPYRLSLINQAGRVHAEVPIGGHVTPFSGGSITQALTVDRRGRILTLTRVTQMNGRSKRSAAISRAVRPTSPMAPKGSPT